MPVMLRSDATLLSAAKNNIMLQQDGKLTIVNN